VGFLTNILGRTRTAPRDRVEPILAASPENPSTSLANPDDWLVDWVHGGGSGVVSERTAMACSAVYRSVSICAGLVAGLPLKIYRRTEQGREEATNHPLAAMLRVAPFPGRPMTSFGWRESWVAHEMLSGNHYSIIRRDGAARIKGFEPLLPGNVEVFRDGYQNLYRCTTWGEGSRGFASNSLPQKVEYIRQDDMIHIPGLGFNGVEGVSRIKAFASNAIGLARTLEDQSRVIHENSARPSGMVTPGPGKISPEGFKRFKAQFLQENTGRRNAGKVLFGDHGAEFKAFTLMSAEDLNTLEFRRFQVADISRFFGVPLHLLNETDKATSWGSGLSEQTLAFLIYTLDPDLSRIEAELNYKLFLGTDFYVEFDRDAMMAMDPVKAAEVAQKEISSGTKTINEYRKQKNRPPVQHGDEPLINTTNQPLRNLFVPAQSAAPPQPAPARPATPTEPPTPAQ